MASPVITVEIAFTTNPYAVPVWVDVTSYLESIPRIKRGRQDELNRFEAGEAEVILNNLDRRFDPTNTAGAYYPNVLPLRRIRITAVFSAVTYRLFTGFVEGWPPEWPLDGTANITLHCVDGFKLFNLNKLNTTLAQEFSGDAVNTLLTFIGWPAGDRSVSSGQSLITVNTLTGTTVLQRLQDITDAENGVIFIRGDGALVFQNRHYRLTTAASTTSQATFGDSGVELPYSDLQPSYDDSQIWNDVRVTAAGGTEQTASDSTSQTTYGQRTLSKSGLILADASGFGGATANEEAANAAGWLLAIYKDPALRFTSLTIRGVATPATLWLQILNRTISDRITVLKRPPGGGAAISQECFIESVEHQIGENVDDWRTTWQLSPTSALTYWILDSTTLSVLDSTTRLAY
jgi:hypothetical protein